ncbi:hypothetical protein AB9P05_05530 [Roseivirga sp. BDSF3-8]|uniref:hypothetical protein n=1 Tax=Roseivirga sp. BDSF3-8 TaxID=3241598 RepID=UPI00353221B1
MMTLIALLMMNFSMLLTSSPATQPDDDGISKTVITNDDGGAGTWMEENEPTPGS